MRTECSARLRRVALVIPLLLYVTFTGCAGVPQALRPGIQVTPEDQELAAWAIRTSYQEIGDGESPPLLFLLLLEPGANGGPRPGRPSERPDFSASVSPTAERRIAAYTRALHAWTRHTGREIAAAIDNESGHQVGPVHQGSEWSVGVHWIELTLPSHPDVTFLHTHPVHVSFSAADVDFFLGHPQVRRMVVTVPDGTIYLLERTPSSQSPVAFAQARVAWEHAMTVRILSNVADYSRLLGPSLNQWYTYQLGFEGWHELHTRWAARGGYIYRRIAPVKGEQ